MAHVESRKHISPDSGYPVVLHPAFNPKIKEHTPPEPIREEFFPDKDRASFADPEKKALLSVAKATDLTENIGTVLENVQLSALSGQQLDELALLVAERGVVFFRDQDLTTDQQLTLFEHYGTLDRHPAQKDQKHVTISGSREDHRELLKYTPWPSGDFHADTSFEINPPSYSMLRMEEHPDVGADTAWVSSYGLYDTLSKHLQSFLDTLHSVHTSRLQYDTIIDHWGAKPNRSPIDTHHSAVRTHPVTNLKALNVNPGFVTGFAELKKRESDALLQFLEYHIHSADDEYVRWKWSVGSVAMWDNRAVLHRVIPGKWKGVRRGVRTTVFGEKPYFDPTSESRSDREKRTAEAAASTAGAEEGNKDESPANGASNGEPAKANGIGNGVSNGESAKTNGQVEVPA